MTAMYEINVSPELRRLLIYCETKCAADCCKSRAFDVSAKLIKEWLDNERIDRYKLIQGEIINLIQNTPHTEKTCWNIRDLKSEWPIGETNTFFRGLGKALEEVRNEKQ